MTSEPSTLKTHRGPAGDALYLLDAMALIHRSFHAIPELTHHGQPVNAVYGFAATLLHILTTLHPTHLAVAFDEPGPTFRDEDFAAYKGTRPPTPEALSTQFPLVRQLVSEFGIPQFGVAGFEADDVIGTLARQASEQDMDTVIVTGDHDAYQLIHDRVWVYNVSRGINHAEFIDADGVRARYGFGPEHMTDYKGLRGDSSDNIPGVPGVGEKTAKALIAQFGSIEHLYTWLEGAAGNSSEVAQGDSSEVKEAATMTPKLKQKLLAHSDLAFLSKKLATIVTSVPIELDLAATVCKHYNEAGARSLLQEWGFRSLLSKLPHAESKPSNQQALF